MFALVLAAPAALASHYTLYHAAGMHREMGTFELNDKGAPTYGNQNGPAGEERRPVPADADVPRRFRNLSDMLVSNLTPPAGARGTLIFDHQMYGSTVESGHIVPYGYYVGMASAAPRTTPTSIHALWYGWWDDVNGDGVIDDEWCAGNGLNCNATDEFVWRGVNTGETLTALAYIFPGDYDASTGVSGLGHIEPSGLAGDCTLYWDNGGCINPGPDMLYADATENEGNAVNQRWAGNNGGGQLTAEEFLVVSQHVVSVAGSPALAESSPEQYRVDCAPPDDCLRDYDWYGGLAGETVDDLYLSAMRSVRDCIWVSNDYYPSCGGLLPPIPCTNPWWLVDLHCIEPVLDLVFSACPVGVPSEYYGCVPDTRHLDARADDDSALRAWTRQTFDTVVPAVGTPQLGPVPPQGFYGDFWAGRNVLEPYSDHVAGGLVRVNAEAWLWQDGNGDGYIGDPSATELELYAMGLDNSPNDSGDCNVADGGYCEVIPRAEVYAGKVAMIRPGSAGWPPGTLIFRHYEQSYWGLLGFDDRPWLEGEPASPHAAVELRMDTARCAAQYFGCRSIDALFLPTGSANGLHGEIGGGVTVAWTEGATPYSVHFDGVWSASI